MADAKMPDVQMAVEIKGGPLQAGKHTSEHRLTALVLLSGFVLQVFASVLGGLQAAGVGQGSPVIPVSLVVISALMQVASVLGYTAARAKLKIASLVGVDVGTDDAPAEEPPCSPAT